MSGSHFIVYGARHGAKSFFEGISDPTFFMSINRILDEGFYREYFDPRLEKTFSFPGLLEFVTDREGLDIADWVPFMKALRAQDDKTAPKVLYWRMVRLDERLDPLIGSSLSMDSSRFAKAGDNQHTLKDGGLDIVQTSVNGGGSNQQAYIPQVGDAITTKALADLLQLKRGTLNARIARAGGALPGLVIEGWCCLGTQVPKRGGPAQALWQQS